MERLKYLKKMKVSKGRMKSILFFHSPIIFYSLPSLSSFLSFTIFQQTHTINKQHSSLPFRIIVLIERDFSTLHSVIAQYSFHSLLQYIPETFVLPLTEPNLDSVIDLFLIRNRFVHHTSSRYVVTIIQTFPDQTQYHCLPYVRQLRMVIFYSIIIQSLHYFQILHACYRHDDFVRPRISVRFPP